MTDVYLQEFHFIATEVTEGSTEERGFGLAADQWRSVPIATGVLCAAFNNQLPS